jgi:hypothetical protein
MKRISADQNVANTIQSVLQQIEQQQEHDERKIEQSLQNLRKHGGVELHLGDHFEIKNMGGEAYVASPGGAKMITIGKMKPSLKGDMYIIGREPGKGSELAYYKATGSGIQKRDCGKAADVTVSRFDLAVFPSGDRVRLFNIGTNKSDLYFEGEVEF